MNENILKHIREYVLIGFKSYTSVERIHLINKLIEESQPDFSDTFTVANLEDVSSYLRSEILDRYHSEAAMRQISELLTDYFIENNITDKDAAESKEKEILAQLDTLEEPFVGRVDISGKSEAIEFKLSEIYEARISTIIPATLVSVVRSLENKKLDEERERVIESTKTEDEKVVLQNTRKVAEDASKPLGNDKASLLERTRSQGYLSAIINEQTHQIDEQLSVTINNILELILKLTVPDSVASKEEKDTIACILNAQGKLLMVFTSKEFVSSYLSLLYAQKGNGIVESLNRMNLHILAEALKTPHTELVKLVLMAMTTCYGRAEGLKLEEERPKSINEIIAAIKKLTQFSMDKKNVKFKRTPPIEPPVVVELSEEAKKESAAYASAMSKVINGDKSYYQKMQEYNKKYKVRNMLKLEGEPIEEAEDCSDKDDIAQVESAIGRVKDVIMNFYKEMFSMPIKMKKFSGIYVFADDAQTAQDSVQDGVLEVYLGDDGVGRLETKTGKFSDLVLWLRTKYEYPIRSKIKVARHNQVPSVENILVNGYNYYPVFVARYALGYVKGERYSTWGKFYDKLEQDVRDRLYKIYKTETTINGEYVSGQDFFVAGDPKRDLLISAFVNSVMFLLGTESTNYSMAQLKLVCGTAHPQEINYFSSTKNSRTGLSYVGTIKYKEIDDEYRQNIIDLTYIQDQKLFYNRVAWAYQELGKAYTEGGVPDLAKKQNVIIGETIDGNLVEYNMADNAEYVTTIFAGSRSGKGVTTLSILSAILASRIGVCYLDCKPDMADCFWAIERRAANQGKLCTTYAYDMNGNKTRYNRSPYEELGKIVGKKSRLYKTSVASALFILKQLQLIMLTSRYKQLHDDKRFIVWVFDELNNIYLNFISGFNSISAAYTDKSTEESDKEFIARLEPFLTDLYEEIFNGATESFGQSMYRFILIGQMPQSIYDGKALPNSFPHDPKAWGDNAKYMLGTITTLKSNQHIVGRGLNINGGFGSKTFHNHATTAEKEALENQRYFIMRKERQVNADQEAPHILFKPYLTLNSDNILDGCWTGGIGASAQYNADAMKADDETRKAMLVNYKTRANQLWGPNTTLDQTTLETETIGTGVVDEGTGFFGLLKTYLNNDEDEVYRTAGKPYIMFTEILQAMDLLGEDSMYGYLSIEDFLYDFSPQAWEIPKYAVWESKHEDWLAARNGGVPKVESTEGDGEQASGIQFGAGFIDANSPEAQAAAEEEANRQAALEAQQRAIEEARQQVEEENRRKAEEAARQQEELERQKAIALHQEQLRAEMICKLQEKKQELEYILDDVKLYGNVSDLAKIDEELEKLDAYDIKITDIAAEVAGIDTTLVDTTSINKFIGQLETLIESKAKMLIDAKSQLQELTEDAEPLQSVHALGNSVEAELNQAPSVLAQVEASEVNPLENSVGEAFNCPDDFDIDLREYYVADDYISNVNNAVSKIEGIYRIHNAGCNTLLNKLNNGPISRDEVSRISRLSVDLRDTLDKTLAPVYDKKAKIDQEIASIEDSDLDVTEYPDKYMKLSEYQSNFDSLVDITELSENIDKLIDRTKDLDKFNGDSIGYKTMCADVEQKLSRIWGIINKSNGNINVSLLQDDLDSLDIACENVKGSMDAVAYIGFNIPQYMKDGYADVVNKISAVRTRLDEIAAMQQNTRAALEQSELEAERLAAEVDTHAQESLRQSQDIIQQVNAMDTTVQMPTAEESSARMAEILRDKTNGAVSEDVLNAVSSSADLDAAVQSANDMAAQAMQAQAAQTQAEEEPSIGTGAGLGAMGGDSGMLGADAGLGAISGASGVADSGLGAGLAGAGPLGSGMGMPSAADLEDDTMNMQNLDQQLSQQTAQAATGGQAGGPIFEDSTGVVDNMAMNFGTQRVQANPSVRMQTANEAQASRIVNNRAVVHSANYLADNIREARVELDEALTRKTNVGFIDKALAMKDLKNRHKLLMKVIGEEVGWGSVTVLELRADMMVVNRQYTIPSTILGDEGYNFYDGILDFDDLLFRKATRINCFVVDQEVSDIMVNSCGGDVYENMFVNIPTLQTIYLGGEKISRRNRGQSIQMAVKAEIERAERSGRGKNAFTESLFASGQLKNTPKNKALANSVVRRAAKTGGRVGNQKGFATARRFLNMTPMQAVTGAIAGMFIGLGNLIRGGR